MRLLLSVSLAALCMGSAHAQLFYDDRLAGPSKLGADTADSFTLFSGYTLGIDYRTTDGNRTYYQEAHSGFRLAKHLTPRIAFRLGASDGQAYGSYIEDSDYGTIHAWQTNTEAEAEYAASRNLSVSLGLRQENGFLSLRSTLLGSDLPGLGVDPSLALSDQLAVLPISLKWKPTPGLSTAFSYGPVWFGGSLTVQSQTGSSNANLPIAPKGNALEIQAAYHRSAYTVSAEARTTEASDASNFSTLGVSVGKSSVHLRDTNVEGALEADWGTRGKAKLELSNLFSSFQVHATDAKPSLIAYSSIDGAIADGFVASRVATTRFSWVSRDDKWNLSLADVSTPFKLSGHVAGQILFFQATEGGLVDYSTVHLAELGVSRKFSFSRCDLRLSLQQVVPIRIHNSAIQTSSTNTGNPSRTTTTLGGTSLGVNLTFHL